MHLALFGFWSRLERKSIQNLVSFSELFFCTGRDRITLQSTMGPILVGQGSTDFGILRVRYGEQGTN